MFANFSPELMRIWHLMFPRPGLPINITNSLAWQSDALNSQLGEPFSKYEIICTPLNPQRANGALCLRRRRLTAPLQKEELGGIVRKWLWQSVWIFLMNCAKDSFMGNLFPLYSFFFFFFFTSHDWKHLSLTSMTLCDNKLTNPASVLGKQVPGA